MAPRARHRPTSLCRRPARQYPEINLVLSDVMMEGTSGYDLLVRIRSLRSSVSVIMISAYESIDLVERCILSGP